MGEQTEDRFVALFNDVIVVAAMDESSSAIGSYKFLRLIPLHKASVKPIPDLPPSSFPFYIYFSLFRLVNLLPWSQNLFLDFHQVKQWSNFTICSSNLIYFETS